MKLTNSRYYLDYNATSPLAPSVIEWLTKGDLPFGNPSGPHAQAKLSKKEIEKVRTYLLSLFNRKDQKLFFHSGATEGINTLVKGLAESEYRLGRSIYFYYSATDHTAVVNQRDHLESYGHKAVELPVDSSGQPNFSLVKSHSGHKTVVVVTPAHNETGRVIDVPTFSDDIILIGDTTQVVGKIEDWEKISPKLNAISFSGHKFGAFKNSGFTIFDQNKLKFLPLHSGAGQEDGLRSGSLDPIGIKTLQLAIDSILSCDLTLTRKRRDLFESEVKKILGNQVEFICETERRNCNTSLMLFKSIKVDSLFASLDLKGIDIGRGASCSSGVSHPNRILMAMGYEKEMTKNVLRYSISPYLDDESFKKSLEIFCSTIR